MYQYEKEKPKLFTDEGQRLFLAIRDGVRKILSKSGAITMGKAMSAGGCGDSWEQMACVDRMVELGELLEIDHGECIAQYRIFIEPQ